MVALKLMNLGGMIPAADERLLPQNNAALVQNAWLYSGAVEGMREPVLVRTLANPNATKVFRIPEDFYDKDRIPNSYWLEFVDPDADAIESPVVGDSFERFYWVERGAPPKYNTKARIATADTPYLLGVPGPAAAMTGSVAGGTVPTETRAYVHTYVTAYGEEGPPSTPVTIVGNANGTWNLTIPAIGGVATDRNITHRNIYRTVTGTTGATTYYFVAQLAIGTTSYADTSVSATVARNNVMASTFWQPPPTDLLGMTAMPNGITAGFREGEIWFTEPYRPHAWPPNYTLSVEGRVVGLGVVGQSLIVCTTGAPYVVSGVNPATMSISRMASTEPCLARGSIVSTPIGVVYASPNGLVLANPGRVEVMTRSLITKDLWLDAQQFLKVTTLRGSSVNGAYYCWGSVLPGVFQDDAFQTDTVQALDITGGRLGAMIDLTDRRIGYVQLTSEEPVDNCFTDVWTGETFIVRDGGVYWLDLAPTRPHEPYLWRSKVFETPNQKNFGAMRVYFQELFDTPELDPVPVVGLNQTLQPGQWGLARFYVDGILRWTRELRSSGEIMRLPSGFKGTFCQVEIEARVQLKSVEVANSPKELGSV